MVLLARSQDGTPIVDVLTPTGGCIDHDENDAPYVRICVNNGEVHQHMSPAAQRRLDELSALDTTPELDQND